ncbi:ethanolamine ammonia-lyase reactivating factor EutA [Brevibacillus sp. SYSU BS000544]|uniref:ethanolamine ammonia-lyase reactivating factor EutA n=1 Tax=Brevibacillus sp. SYSU BS000544 TaxID=3416443 RepID=UPI003CE4D646
MDDQWITSVGIDLGTSTTKMIVSRLRLGRMSSTFSLPRFQIVERQLFYTSPILSTPLLEPEVIDSDRIYRWIQEQYRTAGIEESQVKSGAVIITGETATKQNAELIVHRLAEHSGEFVVATAGADLEGILAGKGSGAHKRSQEIHGAIANVDIGGGTANIAVFERGKTIVTVTFHIGGRLLRIDRDGCVLAVSPHLKDWLFGSGFDIAVGQVLTLEKLNRVTKRIAQSLLAYLSQQNEDDSLADLLVGELPKSFPKLDEIMFSGGVGEWMHRAKPASMHEVTAFGDFGPLLAHVLKDEVKQYPFKVVRPEQTVRATVIGAGMQSVEISGSTLFLKREFLPLRNIPVVKVTLPEHSSAMAELSQTLDEHLHLASKLYDSTSLPPCALAFQGIGYCTYTQVRRLAQEILIAYQKWFPASKLLVVICESDIAKALGQSLQLQSNQRLAVMCIDQIKVEHGDYIDLGEPISDSIIPVVIKTLAF